MDDGQKSLIKFWKVVFTQYLNPVAVIEDLPEYFPVDSRSRNLVLAKDDRPHEAVDILLDELMCTRVPDAYNRFIEAVKRQHPWLISIITGEMDTESLPGGLTKIQFQEYVNKLLSRLLPTLVEGIIATDISMHMKTKGFLNQEEDERIEAKANISGNTAAVRILLAILVRKPIEWLPAFKNIIQQENYSEAVTDIVSDIPDNIEKFCELSNSISMQSQDVLHDLEHTSHYSFISVEQNAGGMKAAVDSGPIISLPKNDASAKVCEISLCHYDLPTSESKEMLEEDTQFPIDKALFENLHGTAVPNTTEFLPANNIIPKEAGYVPQQSKGRPSSGKKLSVSESAVAGESAIIVADERLDIAWNVLETRFPHILDSTDRKIAFIAPKITKDYYVLKNVFVSQQWSVAFCNKDDSDIREAMRNSQVIVITSESFLGWLNEDSDVGKISEFDVLIFDQCFSSYKNPSYNEVLLRCLAARQTRPRFTHTQMIGLANCMNPGKVSGQNEADNIVSELIALFDARCGIEIHLSRQGECKKNPVSKTRINSPSKVQKQRGKKEEITDPLTYYLCEQIDGIVDLMYRLPMRQLKGLQSPRKLSKGSPAYIKWCGDLLDIVSKFEDSSLEYHITNCAKFLQVFNTSYLIKSKCRACDAADYVGKNLKKLLPLRMGFKYETVEKRLTKIADVAHGKVQSLLLQDGIEDGISLKELQDEILAQYKGNAHSQILVVVNDLVLVNYMQSWLKDSVLDNVSKPKQKTVPKGNKLTLPNVIVCHCDDLCKTEQFDLIICYDCSLGIKSPSRTKGKSQRLVEIKCEIVRADDKVKISNTLLMCRAIEKSHDSRTDDLVQYIRCIEQLQSRLLVRKAK